MEIKELFERSEQYFPSLGFVRDENPKLTGLNYNYVTDYVSMNAGPVKVLFTVMLYISEHDHKKVMSISWARMFLQDDSHSVFKDWSYFIDNFDQIKFLVENSDKFQSCVEARKFINPKETRVT